MAEYDHGQIISRNERSPVGAKLKQLQDRLVALGTELMRETDADATVLVSKALDAVQNQRLSVSRDRTGQCGQDNAGQCPGAATGVAARFTGALDGGDHAVAFWAPWFSRTQRPFPVLRRHRNGSAWPGTAASYANSPERFLPGFNSEQLQQQVHAMRHRAEARLGPAFRDLLGSTHSFATLEPDVVAQYVSDGFASASLADAMLPNYADITRTADLFFELAPFAYPLTLIDTPGTNDPFLCAKK